MLSFVLDDLPRRLGRPVPIDIVTGTSVGAIHACYVGATCGVDGAGARLVEIWQGLSVEGVYDLRVPDLVRLPMRLIGLGAAPAPTGNGERLSGLLDTRPLERLVHESVPWSELRRRLDARELEAVAIAATEIASGKSIVWVDRPHVALSSWARDPFVVAREARLGPRHALASAAIPFLFPALRVDGSFYCDGGLRLNTPLAPALRLGADRLLIVGLRHVPTPAEEAALAAHRESNYPTLAYLTGKVLNALLIDHVDYDVDRMTLMNAILEAGVRAYGPEFLARVNQTIEGIRGNPYRIVRHVYLQPSRDIGLIASECIDRRSSRGGLRGWLGDRLVQFAAHGIQMEADLLSYLFFDRCYTEELIALGRRDAEERADDIATLFGDV